MLVVPFFIGQLSSVLGDRDLERLQVGFHCFAFALHLALRTKV
jgi:hypothetical protein